MDEKYMYYLIFIYLSYLLTRAAFMYYKIQEPPIAVGILAITVSL